MINGKIVKAGFFDGIGGFDVAADWMDWHTAFHCEMDEFCKKVLKYYWPHAKNYGDITQADFSFWRGKIDVITGGFPCQPFSTAGKRNGTDDNRYLWPQMCKAIDQIRPAFVLGENVTGILTMEDKSYVSKDVFFRVDNRNRTRLKEVDLYEAVYTRQSKMLLHNIIQDLEKIGYAVQTFIVPASATQAPHRRDRTWIVAYDNSPGLQTKGSQQQTKGRTQNGSGQNVTHPDSKGHEHDQSRKDRCTAGAYKEEENQWERFRANVGGTSVKKDVTDTHSNTARSPRTGSGTKKEGSKRYIQQSKRGEKTKQHTGCSEFSRNATHPSNEQLQRSEFHGGFGKKGQIESKSGQSSRPFPSKWEIFPTQSPVCSGNDGFFTQLDGITFSKWRNQSIKGYGNAVVPQVVLEFYKAIEIELRKLAVGSMH